MLIRSWLAERTKPHHAAVDGAASGFDLAASHGVGGFLAFLADGITAVERRLETMGAEALMPCYPLRTRRHLFPRSDAAEAAGIVDEAGVWGALYVLEGSRLGGRMLARRSSELSVHPAFQPDSFWPVFLDYLELAHRRMDDKHGMAAGAAAAFEAFLPRADALPADGDDGQNLSDDAAQGQRSHLRATPSDVTTGQAQS